MKDKDLHVDDEFSMDESNPFTNPLKIDSELFKKEDNIAERVIRVKRFKKTAEGEVWKIFEDDKNILSLIANKFTNKEKDFLRTPEGFNYIINGYKQGWRSLNKFKKNIKKEK